MGLRAAIFVEIAVDAVAERDDAQDLAGLGRFLGIERFDRSAKLGEIGADARVLVDRLHRPVEKAVRGAGGLADLFAPHRGQLVDLLAEFGAVGIEARKLIDELCHALVELGRFLGLERDQAGGFRRHDGLQRFRWIKLQLGRGGRRSLGSRCGRHQSFLSQPLCGARPEWSTSSGALLLYYRNRTPSVQARDDPRC